MSLDYSIIKEKQTSDNGTGVYIRIAGTLTELKTIEDVKRYFPGADLSWIEQYEYNADIVFDRNITNNLVNMANHIYPSEKSALSLYDLLWHPSSFGYHVVSKEYRDHIYRSFSYMLSNRKLLEQYTPLNGWGSWESLYGFVSALLLCLSTWDGHSKWNIHTS